jgi:hypothetical protein
MRRTTASTTRTRYTFSPPRLHQLILTNCSTARWVIAPPIWLGFAMSRPTSRPALSVSKVLPSFSLSFLLLFYLLTLRVSCCVVVAHEAAAKAQMINSGALTLRARHAPSISAITRPPPRHRACWPSSVSYRCTSTSAQRARRQLSPVVAPPAPPTPSPHPASLTKTVCAFAVMCDVSCD